jgi:hypothetical protein
MYSKGFASAENPRAADARAWTLQASFLSPIGSGRQTTGRDEMSQSDRSLRRERNLERGDAQDALGERTDFTGGEDLSEREDFAGRPNVTEERMKHGVRPEEDAQAARDPARDL